MAKHSFQARLAPGEKVDFDCVVIDSVWNGVKNKAVVVAAIALLVTAGLVGSCMTRYNVVGNSNSEPEPQVIERVIERSALAPVPSQAEPERSRSPWSLPANK